MFEESGVGLGNLLDPNECSGNPSKKARTLNNALFILKGEVSIIAGGGRRLGVAKSGA